MKQTTVGELIKEFQDLKKTLLYPSSFKAVDECIDLCYAKLEMEKQQIIDAQSYAVSHADMTNNRGYFDCEQYYNETFNK